MGGKYGNSSNKTFKRAVLQLHLWIYWQQGLSKLKLYLRLQQGTY